MTTDPTCEHPGCEPGHDCEGQRSLDQTVQDQAMADLFDDRPCRHWVWLTVDCPRCGMEMDEQEPPRLARCSDCPEAVIVACPACRGEAVGAGLRSRFEYGPKHAPIVAIDSWQNDPAARFAGLLREREWDGGSPMSRDREATCLFLGAGVERCWCFACELSIHLFRARCRLVRLWSGIRRPLRQPARKQPRRPKQPEYPRTPEAVRAFFEATHKEPTP